MGYIYLVTNKLNGYQYIGQTLRNDIETRWKQHKMIQKNTIGKYLFNAYNRYGIENFKFEIICICFDEDCNKYEAEYIKKFNTIVPNGYNLQSGGLNYKHHPETIEKMKISLKGKSGVIRDEKWRNNMKIRMSDSKNPNFGKKMSISQKEKISKSQKAKGLNEKRIFGLKKARQKLINEGKYYKEVGKYDCSGTLIESFNSISDASSKTGLAHSTISRVCAGKPH